MSGHPKKLSEFAEFLKAVRESVMISNELKCTPTLSEVVKEERMIIAVNHSTPLSWIPVACTLTEKFMEAGGENRIPFGVADRWFYTNPLTSVIAKYLTQFDRAMEFEELIKEFGSKSKADLVIFPEGANTFFGDVYSISDFRSPKFVEIAIRTNSSILVVCHKGSEFWSLPLQLPKEWGQYILPFSQFFGKKISNSEPFNLPLLMQKIPHFMMNCELYRPSLSSDQLSSDPTERRHQLMTESQKIKELMERLLLAI